MTHTDGHQGRRGARRALAGVMALALAAGWLAGCASILPKLETPRLSLVSVEMAEATLFEQRLVVRLRVQNPNDLVLPVRGLTVDFELAGEDFAQGISARAFDVPAFGEAEFDMMVTANAATALLRVLTQSDARKREALDYVIRGKLSTSLGLLRSVPFEERGQIPLKSLERKPDDRA